MSARTALTKCDGALVTIRSKKSFFEVTKAIESSLVKSPETAPSDVPQLLDTEMVKVFEDTAA